MITCVGSCRIDLGDTHSNNRLNTKITYTHSSKEALQFLYFCLGKKVIPEEYSNFIFRSCIMEGNLSLKFDADYTKKIVDSKFVIIEICSRKVFKYEDYVLHHLAGDLTSYSSCKSKIPTFVKNNTVKLIQTDIEIEDDILELVSLIGSEKIIFVSHFSNIKLKKINDHLYHSRQTLVDLLERISRKYSLKFINPGIELINYEICEILSGNMGHYTSLGKLLFEKILIKHLSLSDIPMN